MTTFRNFDSQISFPSVCTGNFADARLCDSLSYMAKAICANNYSEPYSKYSAARISCLGGIVFDATPGIELASCNGMLFVLYDYFFQLCRAPISALVFSKCLLLGLAYLKLAHLHHPCNKILYFSFLFRRLSNDCENYNVN